MLTLNSGSLEYGGKNLTRQDITFGNEEHQRIWKRIRWSYSKYTQDCPRSVLVNAAKKNSKQRAYGKNVLKLKFLNQDITDALKANKTAYKEWKEANSPMDIENPWLLQKKKTTRKIFRNSLRNEDLRRKHETRNDLIN
jgi:hypothetical protein